MQGVQANGEVAELKVITTSGRGHSVEQVADLLLNRIIGIADTALPEIAMQAKAFREVLRPNIEHYMKLAIASSKTTLYNQFRAHGQHEAAELLLKL